MGGFIDVFAGVHIDKWHNQICRELPIFSSTYVNQCLYSDRKEVPKCCVNSKLLIRSHVIPISHTFTNSFIVIVVITIVVIKF